MMKKWNDLESADWTKRTVFFALLAICTPLAVASGWLTDRGEQQASREAPVYADVAPVLERLCSRCHGERKQRGGLALHSAEAFQTGGDSGALIALEERSASLILEHLLAPLDADEHMPPEDEQQPTAEELALLQAFVMGDPRPPGAPAADPQGDTVEEVSGPRLQLDPIALAQLRVRLAHVQALAPDSDGLWVDFSASVSVAGDVRELLEPLSAQLAELCFAGKQLTQADLDFLGGLPALAKLDLRRAKMADLDFSALAVSRSIQTLNLAGTPLAPGSLKALLAMGSLRRVDLWGTGLAGSAPELRAARPALVVNLGSEPREAIEAEPEVLFERPVAPVAATAELSLAELNTDCPVTGKPVDARYIIVHEGRLIGFCCPNCPKTFWDDPAPFVLKLDEQD